MKLWRNRNWSSLALWGLSRTLWSSTMQLLWSENKRLRTLKRSTRERMLSGWLELRRYLSTWASIWIHLWKMQKSSESTQSDISESLVRNWLRLLREYQRLSSQTSILSSLAKSKESRTRLRLNLDSRKNSQKSNKRIIYSSSNLTWLTRQIEMHLKGWTKRSARDRKTTETWLMMSSSSWSTLRWTRQRSTTSVSSIT